MYKKEKKKSLHIQELVTANSKWVILKKYFLRFSQEVFFMICTSSALDISTNDRYHLVFVYRFCAKDGTLPILLNICIDF